MQRHNLLQNGLISLLVTWNDLLQKQMQTDLSIYLRLPHVWVDLDGLLCTLPRIHMSRMWREQTLALMALFFSISLFIHDISTTHWVGILLYIRFTLACEKNAQGPKKELKSKFGLLWIGIKDKNGKMKWWPGFQSLRRVSDAAAVK